MNISELARRVRATPDELRQKLPTLGFDVGHKAIKVDDRLVPKIMEKWSEMKRMERLKEKYSREQVIREAAVAKVQKVALPTVISVRDFATRLSLPLNLVIGELMKNGILASVNERIDFMTASIVAGDLGFEVAAEAVGDAGEDTGMTIEKMKELTGGEDDEKLAPRPPVVVVMGHVDHGKTMLLDTIRATSVVKKEAGGITQHIGAYQAEKKGRRITFIDTPGHEAFTVMRSRGARVADVAVLVVAADDGVQPQTLEVIKIIDAAKLPVVVALNKIDKPDADPQRVKTQLSEKGLIPEEWGGKTPVVPVSAKTGQGLEDLLDVILLVAEIDKGKIRANPERRAMGTVIESHVDKGEGVVATVLVQTGTLRPNDSLAVGDSLYGRVRAMKDWNGVAMREALPGTPVKILGLKSAPAVGDIIAVPEDATALKKVKREHGSETQAAPALSSASAGEEQSSAERKALNVVLKADVLGSLEAIAGTLEKMNTPEVGVVIVGKGLGNVTDGDVLRADAAGGVVLGFNVMPTRDAEVLARDKKIEVLQFKIIYGLFDEVKKRLQDLLPAEKIVTQLGKLQVLATFRDDKTGQVVGGRVIDGKIAKGASMVVYRGEQPVGEGSVLAVQSGRNEVPEMRLGQECGVKVQTRAAVQVDDILELFTEEKRERKLVLPV